MLIDIIIPVYNGERYIHQCFEMFRNQPSEDYRLLFVNDGSKDNSLSKINEEIAAGGVNAVVIDQPNGGVSCARNTGIKNAAADYITFVDVDDLVSEDYISVLTKAAKENDFDTFVFRQERVYADKASTGRNDAVLFETISKTEELERFFANPTKLGVYNILCSRRFLTANGIIFPVGYKYYEDYRFLYTVFALSSKILSSDAVLYYYLLQDGSAMARFSADRINCLEIIEELSPFIKENAPEFSEHFDKWAVSRLRWSVLWQGAMAAPSYRLFKELCVKVGAKSAMDSLTSFPDKKVKMTSLAFKFSPRFFFTGARLLGGRHSKIAMCSAEEFEKILSSC